MEIRIKLTSELFAIFAGFLLEVHDEGFDLFSARPAESLGATEVRGVGLHEIGIEVVLADEKAKLIAQPGLAVAGTIGGRMPLRR